LDATDNLIEKIKDTILKYVSARYIYLFGSHAYGEPTDDSDVDIYVVVPDETQSYLELYGKIIADLSLKKIYFIDLLFNNESSFNIDKEKCLLEKTIINKGKLLYE